MRPLDDRIPITHSNGTGDVTMYPLILATLMFIVVTAKGEVASGTGLQLSASADILGQFDLTQDSGGTNRLEVREAEVIIY